ncbi:hypothetical protein BSZ35_15250 [Salinibacter sp. 10B]|uniref:hypothetical protein n=1 Tax=Salinibacter sp. 10B TaxID=1923971 RepID=UPI000CF36CFA|nr:hypothetical protein [Salinibacter sp. 10B]PQJ35768.1 hypothetical protein BSZ35_15250 [Salinibacter sp. 10B]
MNPFRSFNFFSGSSEWGSDISIRASASLIGGSALLLLLSTVVGGNSLSKQWVDGVSSSLRSIVTAEDTTVRTVSYTTLPATPVLRELPSHPADMLSPYMNPAADPSSVANPNVLRDFHDLLAQFAQRQAQDDNFTVRVIDRRTDSLLELYEFPELRSQYRRGASITWREIDQKRRAATRRLVDKYERRGVPLEDIIVRWGRANQVEQAQARNQPYQAYEIQLAHYLGLSLLPTQMGTVETFNQDDLVSSVGAQSRYQMMPWILRKSGVHEYTLPTEAGARVEVEEAHHPLLTLEPAYLLLRGYINAVGHEIPGLSAYHTGPGNIWKLYRRYYTESPYYTSASTVVDAYIWAVSTGFDTVREGSSFGAYSRGYIPSAYGALVAQDRTPLNLSQSMQAERVQLKPGTRVSLQTILTTLDTTAQSFDWTPVTDQSTTYERFRAFNDHFDLPDASGEGVPATGNVELVSTLDGKAVRFFLPLGASEALRDAGLDVIDPDLSFRFDGSTYTPPDEEQRTVWDRRYDALVDDIKHFGFTPENRDRLLELHDKFEMLAEENPSRYRRRQLDIIQTHRRLWLSGPWEELSDLTMQVTGRTDVPVQPPIEIPTDDTTSFLQRLFP